MKPKTREDDASSELDLDFAEDEKVSDIDAGSPDAQAPLPAQMRPRTLADYVGQRHILGEGSLLRRAIESNRFSSLIFWGPPGTGKTTLAEIIALQTHCAFVRMSGVFSTVGDMRTVLEQARARRRAENKGTLVFIDEIHRWNKAQQDVLLPHVERGTIRLIGATTENPHFYVVGPLISRSLVFQLEPLDEADLAQLLERGARFMQEKLGSPVVLDPDAVAFLTQSAEGDGRKVLGALEVAALTTPVSEGVLRITVKIAEQSMQKKYINYGDDGHYDTASALIKSMRGSDPDAAVYYLAKMLHAGEDIRFIARRVMIFASEDVGNADPRALQVAVAAMQAVSFVGMPEARIILAQAVTYVATAPKSNACICAIDDAMRDVREQTVQPVPRFLRDAHYKGAESLGHTGYVYVHNLPEHFSCQEYLGVPKSYYKPGEFGFEVTIRERMNYWQKLRLEAKAEMKKASEQKTTPPAETPPAPAAAPIETAASAVESDEALDTADKAHIRKVMRQRRRAITEAEHACFDAQINARLLNLRELKTASCPIAVYRSDGTEPDLDAFIQQTLKSGQSLLFPRYCPTAAETENAYELTELTAHDDYAASFELGPWSIPEMKKAFPAWDLKAPNRKIVWIVPGVAFSAQGARLGRGKAVYDRFCAALPGLKIGVFYDCQCVESLPEEAHDLRLDIIVTPTRTLRVRRLKLNLKGKLKV